MFMIAKTFSFSAAHRIMGLIDGHKCGRLHGHNWEVEVIVKASNLDSRGFAQIDYGDMSPFKRWIDENWDHRTLLCCDDSIIIDKESVVFLNCQPTAENLARILLYKAKELIGDIVFAIRVSETPKTWAECSTPNPS